MKTKHLFILLIFMSVWVFSVNTVSSELIIDKGYVDWEGNENGEIEINAVVRTQRFRPSVGNLARVSLNLKCSAVKEVTVWVTNTSHSGIPSSNIVVATATNNTIGDGAYHWINFNFYYPTVVNTPNINYYISAYSVASTDHVAWRRADNCDFSGSYTLDSSYDLWYKTYYDTEFPIYIDQGDVEWVNDGKDYF